MENAPRQSAACPFCTPEESEGLNRILRQNVSAYLTLSNPRKMPGHALVIPKRHVENPWELTREEIQDIFELISFAQRRILEHELGTGTQVRQNYLPYISEGMLKVSHVHYHVMPRSFKDALHEQAAKFEDGLFAMLSDEERQRIEAAFS